MKKQNKQFHRYSVPRNPDTSKYDYGHVLVISGSRGMTGAPLLVATAALRSGAGLVTCAVPDAVYPMVASQCVESMTLPLPSTRNGALSCDALDTITAFIKQRFVTSVVIGPGISREHETMALVQQLVKTLEVPVVLDADGLFAFVGKNKRNSLCINGFRRKYPLIITPHHGEMARLIGLHSDDVKKNREEICTRVAQENGIICVLKGHNTIVSDGKKICINPTGNAGMATAGSGDVLAGIIGALVADKKNHDDFFTAVAFSVFVHGKAGDCARKKYGERSLIARDIVECLINN